MNKGNIRTKRGQEIPMEVCISIKMRLEESNNSNINNMCVINNYKNITKYIITICCHIYNGNNSALNNKIGIIKIMTMKL